MNDPRLQLIPMSELDTIDQIEGTNPLRNMTVQLPVVSELVPQTPQQVPIYREVAAPTGTSGFLLAVAGFAFGTLLTLLLA